jgi:hypothetical protein
VRFLGTNILERNRRNASRPDNGERAELCGHDLTACQEEYMEGTHTASLVFLPVFTKTCQA